MATVSLSNEGRGTRSRRPLPREIGNVATNGVMPARRGPAKPAGGRSARRKPDPHGTETRRNRLESLNSGAGMLRCNPNLWIPSPDHGAGIAGVTDAGLPGTFPTVAAARKT